MEFNFDEFKEKYSHDTESKIFVGNAAEIRNFINAYEQQQTAIEDMSKELKIANDMIKDLKQQVREKSPEKSTKAAYEDLDDE